MCDEWSRGVTQSNVAEVEVFMRTFAQLKLYKKSSNICKGQYRSGS